MGAMSRMRNSTPIVLWVLIFSFGVLWVLQDTQVFDALAGGPASLGSVNGDDISLEEFNNRVSFYVDQYSQQSSEPMPSGMRADFEEQAWEDLVAERLMAQKMEKLGIVVTDEELVNMIVGENPDPFIRQQFQDEQGRIDRVALQAAIDAPENQEIWVLIEQQLRQNRQQQKLTSFIISGMRVSARDIEKAYKRENSYADIRFVRFPYSAISDDEIEVTDREIRDYYDANRSRFHRDENYRFSYVRFVKEPTSEDTVRTRQDVEMLRDQFAEAEDHAAFLQQVESAVPYRDSFVRIDEMRDEYLPVLELEAGEVSELHMIDGDPHLFKLVERDGDRVKFAILSYRVQPDPIATIDRLAEEAEEFVYFAREDGFEDEAEVQGFTIHRASATKGTPVVPEIGSARPLVRELESLRRGQISEVVELSDAFIVARMDEVISEGPRPLSEVSGQIEGILRDRKRMEIAADRLRDGLRGDAGLEQIAEAAGLEVQSASNLRMGGNSIPGAGREPGVIGAVFGLEQGERSGIVEGEAAVFVLQIEQIDLADPAGMTLQEREGIRQRLEQEKFVAYNDVWIDKLKDNARIRDNRRLLLGR